MWVWCPDFVVNRYSLSGLSPGGTGSGRWLRVTMGANKSVNRLHLELKIWVSRVKFGILIRVPRKPGVQIWAKGGTTNVLSTLTLGVSYRSFSVRVPGIWFLPMPPEGDLSHCTQITRRFHWSVQNTQQWLSVFRCILFSSPIYNIRAGLRCLIM